MRFFILSCVLFALTSAQTARRLKINEARRELQDAKGYYDEALFHTEVFFDDLYYKVCSDSDDGSSNAECGTGAFCDPHLEMGSACLVCPTKYADCTENWLGILSKTEGNVQGQGQLNCEKYCRSYGDPKVTGVDKLEECQYLVDGQGCSSGNFCVVHPEWDVNELSQDHVMEGICAPCAVVDTIPWSAVDDSINLGGTTEEPYDGEGSLECFKWPHFNYDMSHFTCRATCEKEEQDSITPYNIDGLWGGDFADNIRLSDLEAECWRKGLKTGCCMNHKYESYCEDPDNAVDKLDSYHEMTDPCAVRYCDSTLRDGHNYCVVQIQSQETTCTRAVVKTTTFPYEYTYYSGRCVDGTCVIDPEEPCPPHTPVELWSDLGICEDFGFDWGTSDAVAPTEASNKYGYCAWTGGNVNMCTETPRDAKHLMCWSNTEYDDRYPRLQKESITKDVTNWMWMTYFSSYDADLDRTGFTAFGNSNGLQTGRCIIGFGLHANYTELDDLWHGSDCIIKHPGEYIWRGQSITWWTAEINNTRSSSYQAPYRESVLYIPRASKRLAPNMYCHQNEICYGSFNCRYYTADSEGGFPCGGSFRRCTNGTYDPTIDPTLDPTMMPSTSTTTSTTTTTTTTTTTPPTLHGDPIIWTLNGECYDLNKDGLYVSSTHEKFDHDVHIGVYNDFVREIQVTKKDSNEIILTISATGVYEAEGYPFGFETNTKPCPKEMKDTECVDTYVEFKFDAQDFNYLVHILRHDYKDPSLKEGEFGYHLDVYPRTYDSFEKRKADYHGAFFENPLPEELEYCRGGSPRRES